MRYIQCSSELIEFLDENVWPDGFWRTERGSPVFERLYPALHPEDPTAVVPMGDSDFEIFLPIATLQHKQVNPRMAVQVHAATKPIFLAPTKDPRPKNPPPDEGADKEDSPS